MQRRLTIALVATALASILLVGFGVLLMAQLGARASAEREVQRPLNVVSDFFDSSSPGDRLRQLAQRGRLRDVVGRARSEFGLEVLEAVIVTDDGMVSAVGGGRTAPAPIPQLELDTAQLAELEAGGNVLISGRTQVVGLRRIDVPVAATQPDDPRNGMLAILAVREVSAVSRQAVAWFLLSSLAVLAAATATGLWLARRLTRPIQAIKTTTSAIAAGDLGARVEVAGNDELSDLGQAVNQMAGDLQRSKALDRQFLMSVSHDLKTPLTAITGYAEGLADGAVTDARAAGRIIQSHAERLDLLVGDLLDLARLDANRFRLHIRPFDLGVVAGRTVAGLAPQARRHGITLDTSGLTSVMADGDTDRTAQAIGNLIDNAIKFARTTVRIACTADGAVASVTVCDDGPGIPPEDLAYVFDRLYTGAAQPERAENPTGLGLAIVRELANAMGGRVEAANAPEGGACLRLDLPLSQAPGPTPGAGAASPRSAPSRPMPSPLAANGGPPPSASGRPDRSSPAPETPRPS